MLFRSNPVYYKNQAIGTSNYGTSRWLYLGQDHLSGYIEIPRGLYGTLIENIERAQIAYEIEDERQLGRNINVEFKGEWILPYSFSHFFLHIHPVFPRIWNRT